MAEYHTTSGKLADPEFRAQRARKAGAASHGLSAHVRAVVRNAGRLTPEDAELLRSLLPAPGRGRTGDGGDLDAAA